MGNRATPDGAQQRVKVLIIEDDERAGRMLANFLEKQQYDVASATDGASGIGLFEEQEPDIVLVDIHMPHLSGCSVVNMIRQYAQHQPHIVVMTGSPDDFHEHLTGTHSHLFAKPVDLRRLTRLMETLRTDCLASGADSLAEEACA